MSATVHELPSHVALRRPLGHAIRTGESSYRQLEHLYAEGRLPSETVIVDASKARFQREFIRSLREHGSDIILDTARMYEQLAERDRPIARPIRRRNVGVAGSGLRIR